MQICPNKTIKVANMKNFIISRLCLALVLCFPILLWAQEPLPVEETVVHWQDYSKPVRISGVLENKSEQNLAFKVSGLVKQIKANEGQWVKAGQVLAALDLEEINAQVAKAQSVLDNAERNLGRFQSLQGQNALSIDQLQAAETQVDVARSDLTVAKFNLRHAVIRAPADGRVLKRYIENNEMVAPGTPAFVFAPNQGGWVMRAGVTDRDIVRLNLKNPIHLLAFGLGSGLAPKAPGTFGTLAALPIWWFLLAPLSIELNLAVLLIGFLIGVAVCEITSRDMGVHDHGGIVIDEWIGMWITLLWLPFGQGLWPDLAWLAAGFVAFRFFDIIKPWPIRWLDKKVAGGFGIMIDDILAGVFALVVIQLAVYLF